MPEWSGHIRSRLTALRIDPGRETEIVEELSEHLAQRYEELRDGGATEAEALHLTLEELAGPGRRAGRAHEATAPGPGPTARYARNARR